MSILFFLMLILFADCSSKASIKSSCEEVMPLAQYPTVVIELANERAIYPTTYINEPYKFFKNHRFVHQTEGGMVVINSAPITLHHLEDAVVTPYRNKYLVWDTAKGRRVQIRNESSLEFTMWLKSQISALEERSEDIEQIDNLLLVDPWWHNSYFHDIGIELGTVLLCQGSPYIGELKCCLSKATSKLDAYLTEKGVSIWRHKEKPFKVKNLFVLEQRSLDNNTVIHNRTREFVMPLLRSPISPKLKILISRSDAFCRRCVNEDSLLEILRPFGFQKVILSEMDILSQFALFRDSDFIISPHGAALTHLVCCEADTKVVELFRQDTQTSICFFSIASIYRLKHYTYVGDSDGSGSDYLVDVSQFKAWLENVIGNLD